MVTPNVLLIVVDSMRADEAFGDRTSTPTIDSLRDEGVTFTRCFSQGISTAPAMTAMLTGRLPLDYSGHWHLAEDEPTFAQTFNENGYTTGAFHSNPYVSAQRNFDRGFDKFLEDVVSFEPDNNLGQISDSVRRIFSRVSRILSRTPYTTAETMNERVRDYLHEASEPWFCWTQYMDVHGPYLGGDDFRYSNKFRAEWLWQKAAVREPDEVTDEERAMLRRNYCLEIEYLDAALGDLFDDLQAEGTLEDTVIVLTADHGDEFYEHGRYGHGNLPYDELIHVPFVLRLPEDSATLAGTKVDEMVRCIDILPTVLDYIDADIGAQHRERIAGESLLPLIRGEDRSDSPTVVTEKRVKHTNDYRIALRETDWKYIFDGTTDERFLFNLTSDPDETTDVSDSRASVQKRFEELLEERLAQVRTTTQHHGERKMEPDVAVQERLRALGYRD